MGVCFIFSADLANSKCTPIPTPNSLLEGKRRCTNTCLELKPVLIIGNYLRIMYLMKFINYFFTPETIWAQLENNFLKFVYYFKYTPCTWKVHTIHLNIIIAFTLLAVMKTFLGWSNSTPEKLKILFWTTITETHVIKGHMVDSLKKFLLLPFNSFIFSISISKYSWPIIKPALNYHWSLPILKYMSVWTLHFINNNNNYFTL